MKTLFFALFATVNLIVALPSTPAHAAGGFDDDVFGSYIGFRGGGSNKSVFQLQFSQSLQLSYSSREKGVLVREMYRVLESGRFIGIAKARGRIIATVSGNWTGTPRSINASGKARLINGRKRRFSSRINFGQGTVSVFTRGADGVVRSSGVKR